MSPREMKIIRESVAMFLDELRGDERFCSGKLRDPNSVVSQRLELMILKRIEEDDG
jgi:hypothetical protein